LVNRQQLLDQN